MILSNPTATGLCAALLCLTVATGVPASPGSAMPQEAPIGTWLGTLSAGGAQMRIVFHIEADTSGALSATLDSPDQGATGIPISEVAFSDGKLEMWAGTIGGRYEGTVTEDGERFEGEWRQGGGAFPLDLARTDEIEPPPRPQNPDPPFPYRSEEVAFSNPEAGINLAGTLTLPEGEGPFPAVALVTGSGPQDRDETVFSHKPFLVLSDNLTRRGIAVLRYDDRGVGGSEGSFGEATSEDFASDAGSAVAYLASRGEIDASRIGVAGHSEGGLVAPMVAVVSPGVAFIVLLAGPGVTGSEILHAQSADIMRANGISESLIERNVETQEMMFGIVAEEPDREVAAERLRVELDALVNGMSDGERAMVGMAGEVDAAIEQQIAQVNSPWMRFFLSYDPAPTLRRVDVPVLAINGSLDLQVPAKMNLSAISAALEEGGNPDFQTHELKDLNHLFQPAATGLPTEYASIETTFAPEALELIGSWILERFGEP